MTNSEEIQISPGKIARLAGIFYLLTFVSIPTLTLYGSIHDLNYVTNPGPDWDVFIGGILEIILALAGIATAVVLYSILKKQNEMAALGLIASRVLEASTMFAGVAFLLTAVTLRQSLSAAEATIVSQTLVTLYDKMFLVGQSFIPAVNDILLGFLLYKSRLVPRILSVIGIIGSPCLIAGFVAVTFGLIGRLDPLAALSAVPVALFEFSLGIWLVVKGFNPSAPLMLSSGTKH